MPGHPRRPRGSSRVDPLRLWRASDRFGWTLLAVASLLMVGTAMLSLVAPRNDEPSWRARDREALERVYGWSQAPCPKPTSGPVTVLAATRHFRFDASSGIIEGDAVDGSSLDTASSLVRDELRRYPAAFLARLGLRQVVLCRALTRAGQPIPSLPNVDGALLLEPDEDEAYLRRLVHHEVFHFFDYVDDGSLSHDPSWEALNPEGFCYGPGGRAVRAHGAARFDHEQLGFLSLYSTSAVEEDKAELFSFAMVAPSLVSTEASRDVCLARKLTELRTRLTRFDPVAAGLL